MRQLVLQVAFCFLLSFFITVPGYAANDSTQYSIQGGVFEKGTGQALFGATVFVYERDDLYTETNQDGSFKLIVPEPGVYPLSVAMMGYERLFPVAVKVGLDDKNQSTVSLYLMPSVVLEPVVVQADRNKDRVGKTVITGEEADNVAGSAGDPLKALQTFPGVTVNNDFSSEPAIRGSRPGDNAYYIDDIPVSYMFHIGGLVSVVPAYLVSDFNLYASNFGPQYDDVTGGVLDIQLRDAREDRLGGVVDVSLVSADFLLEGPIADNQSFYLSARRSYFDLLVNEIEDEDEGVRFVVPNYWDYIGKYQWDINGKNRFSFYLNGAGDEGEFSIDEDSDIAQKEPVLAGDSLFDSNYHNQTAILDTRVSKTAVNKLMFGHRDTVETSKIGTAFDLEFANDIFFIRDQFSIDASKSHNILLGAGYEHFNIDLRADGVNLQCNPELENCDPLSDAERASFDDTLKLNAWNTFVRDRWRFLDNMVWITGVRFSTEDYLNKSFIEPRLGFEWDVNKNTLFTAGWGQYHQFPSGQYVIEEFGNPNLDHIQANHSSMGVQHSIGKDWFVKSEVYYKTFKNFVVGDEELRYINNATGVSYGLEMLVKKNPTDKLSGWASLTLSEANRTNNSTGETFPFEYSQPVIFVLAGNYKFLPLWNFGLTWHYHTGAPYTPIVGNEQPDSGSDRYTPVYGELNSERFPDYHRLDIRIDRSWLFNTWTLQAYFEIINLYDSCNVAGYDYNVSYTARDPICQLPFLPYFGVRAIF